MRIHVGLNPGSTISSLLKLKNILTHKFAEISIFLADILSISFDGLIFGYNGPQFQHKKLL